MTKFNKIQIKTTLNYFRVLFFSSLLASSGYILSIPDTYFGFGLSGYAWILVFFVSIYYILNVVKRTAFSINIWSIWIFLLISYLLFYYTSVGLQGTIQFIVPILVGYVTGGLKYNTETLYTIVTYFKYLIIILFLATTLFAFIKFGILGYGPATDAHLTSFGAVISMSLFYHTKNKKYLLFYCIAALIPILAVTRMGIFIMFIIPFVHFYKFFSSKKLFIVFLMIPVSIYVFNLPSVQEKMFFDGKGKLSDIEYSGDNFNSSGRSTINEFLIDEFLKMPIMGLGTRADYFLLQKKDLHILEAHNDYLQILVCYGIIGMFLFLITFIIQIKKIKTIKLYSINEKLLRATLFTLIIPMLLFMATDNVLRLGYSFMNYFFALMGMLFAINKQNQRINKYNNANNNSYPFI